MEGGDIGDVRWHVSGNSIRGYIVNQGANVATFSGDLFEGGAAGNVKTAYGYSGTWVWDGPLLAEGNAAEGQTSAPTS